MRSLKLLAAAVVIALPGVALSDAAGVGVGATTGTYNASAASGGVTFAPVGVSGQVGTFSQSAGTQSTASAGMGIGANQSVTLSVASDGIDNGSIGIATSSSATVEGFGTASSVTSNSYAGNGIQAGSVGATISAGTANAAGAFLGVGIIAADSNL